MENSCRPTILLLKIQIALNILVVSLRLSFLLGWFFISRGFAQVDKPVHQPDHHCTTDDVSDGDRQQVLEEEIAPGQVREGICSLSDGFKELNISTVLDEQSHGDKVHISNTVLESGGNEA